MFSVVSQRVLQTIAYTDQFHFPLRLVEVWQRLLARAPLKVVQNSLVELVASGALVTRDGYYFISPTDGIDPVSLRQDRERQARNYQSEIKQLVASLRYLPWIRGVAITGSLSMGVAQPGDDIDLMIITQPNRLWLTRLLVTAVASLQGRRRYWWEDSTWLGKPTNLATTANQAIPPKWCLNLWLTTDNLAVTPQQRSIYTAYEVLQAKFLFTKVEPGSVQTVEQAFLTANEWVMTVTPQYWWYRRNQAKEKQNQFQDEWRFFYRSKFVLGPVLTILNEVVFWVQKWYMNSHMTSEKVARSFAYFHPRPTRQLVAEGWQAALQRALWERN